MSCATFNGIRRDDVYKWDFPAPESSIVVKPMGLLQANDLTELEGFENLGFLGLLCRSPDVDKPTYIPGKKLQRRRGIRSAEGSAQRLRSG